jgi:hypothetical protein
METSSTPGNVQVMNVLDVPQAHNTLEQFALADNGFLEGIPGGMFDWGESVCSREKVLADAWSPWLGQWETFFARFNGQAAENPAGLTGQQRQRQRQQQQQKHNASVAANMSNSEQSQDNQNGPDLHYH